MELCVEKAMKTQKDFQTLKEGASLPRKAKSKKMVRFKDETKSSHDTVEDIEKSLFNLLEIGARHESCIESFLENPVLSKNDFNDVIEAYEALEDIVNQLVKTHTKWVEMKKLGGCK